MKKIVPTLRSLMRKDSFVKCFSNKTELVKTAGILGDDVDEICEDIQLLSRLYTYVITSGGIGPTHDDITFEAVARAFNKKLVLHPELRQLCEQFFNTTDVDHPGMKLACIPEAAKLTYSENSKYPIVSVNNVYIFPGVPELFVKSFGSLCETLFKSKTIFYKKNIYFNVTESTIAAELRHMSSEFPCVQFGSYPELYNTSYKVRVTIESTSEGMAIEAFNKLLQVFPKENIVTVK